jgi:transcriptional regulator with XRE-family HTH domain
MQSQKAIIPAPSVLTPRLCKAARALLGWNQDELAAYSAVGASTVKQYEAGLRMLKRPYLMALEVAFKDAGIEFVPGGVVFREMEAA